MATQEKPHVPAPAPAPTSEPKIEVTINTKPNLEASAITDREAAEEYDPIDFSEDEWAPRGRARRGVRPCPPPFRDPTVVSVTVASSSRLLYQFGKKYDGVIDLPYPARSSVYMANYPFTDRDIKKYSWLFAQGVEDIFLAEHVGDPDHDHCGPAVIVGSRRSSSPYYEPNHFGDDVPAAFLSRALDTAVVPEDTKDVRYWIVVHKTIRNRAGAVGVKLVVADSRKAAGILIYHELLNGHSVPFVGAVLHHEKRYRGMTFKKVASLEEATALQNEGKNVCGIVC